MTRTIDVAVTIDRPADEVWRALTDWAAAPRWMNGIDGMRAGGPTAVGTELVFEARGKARSTRITACAPGRAVTLSSHQGPVRAEYTYTVEPIDDATSRAALVADCAMTGPMRVLAPLLRRVIRKTDGGQMNALKAVIEGTP